VWCEVIRCRQEGRRLKRAEWPEPVRGHLKVRSLAAADTSFRRAVVIVELLNYQDAFRTVLTNAGLPIFEPQLLPAPHGKLLIRGIELSVKRDASGAQIVFEHEQVWLCTPMVGQPSGHRAAVTEPLPHKEKKPPGG
jgi:hypothetical protein